VHREEREYRFGEFQRRDPEPRRRLETRREVHEPAADKTQCAARRIVEPRFGRVTVGPAQLDEPELGGQAL
jgi:hypothetical protein